MSKIAGLKGRSPETYPTPKASSNVQTQSHVNPSPVPLGTSLASLLTSVIDVAPENKAIVTYSGVITNGGGASVLVAVEVLVDGALKYLMEIEVTSVNYPLPFSLTYETPLPLGDTPDPHTIDIQASASLASTATVEAGGSIVVISTSA